MSFSYFWLLTEILVSKTRLGVFQKTHKNTLFVIKVEVLCMLPILLQNAVMQEIRVALKSNRY